MYLSIRLTRVLSYHIREPGRSGDKPVTGCIHIYWRKKLKAPLRIDFQGTQSVNMPVLVSNIYNQGIEKKRNIVFLIDCIQQDLIPKDGIPFRVLVLVGQLQFPQNSHLFTEKISTTG
jgi:hypothetical protein